MVEKLPLNSADMYYHYDSKLNLLIDIPFLIEEDNHFELFLSDIPCWSLAALLYVIPSDIKTQNGYHYKLEIDNTSEECNLTYREIRGKAENIMTRNYNNLIDACVHMISGLKFMEYI